MGYLDNSTIVVDAVLTKQGRKLLALGQGLNISYFTLTDTGIDYSLWNADHPSGSAYYGEAIENLPNLEALPNSAYFMRNNLITLGRQVTTLPYVTVNGIGIGLAVSHAFGEGDGGNWPLTPELQGGQTETQGWQLIIPDKSLIDVVGANWKSIDISGNALQYLNDQEIQAGVVYEAEGAKPQASLKRLPTSTSRSITITVISKSTGAYKHITFTMDKTPA